MYELQTEQRKGMFLSNQKVIWTFRIASLFKSDLKFGKRKKNQTGTADHVHCSGLLKSLGTLPVGAGKRRNRESVMRLSNLRVKSEWGSLLPSQLAGSSWLPLTLQPTSMGKTHITLRCFQGLADYYLKESSFQKEREVERKMKHIYDLNENTIIHLKTEFSNSISKWWYSNSRGIGMKEKNLEGLRLKCSTCL